MRLIIVLGLLAAPAAVAAQERQQFDLVCKGQQRILPSRRSKPYEVRYRIDLGAGAWCSHECTAPRPLVAANAAEIVFQATGRSDEFSPFIEHNVNRTTGRWRYYNSGDSEAEGACVVRDFTGFPPAKF